MSAPAPGGPGTERVRLATAGARAVTENIIGRQPIREVVLSNLFLALLLLAITVAMLGIVAIIVQAIVNGAPAFSTKLFTNGPSTVNPSEAGFRPALIGTVYLILGVILIIVPLGVSSALYLEEYANREKWWNRLIELNVQNLAGVPSIVFGILGLAFIVRGPLSLGFVLIAGSMTIALLVLPTVILAAREAIRAVPPSIREGSLALGATKWQTLRRQVLPAAVPGITTGVILAVSRSIGEVAPLLLVGASTFVTFNPTFFGDNGYSALPVLIFNYASRPQDEFRILASAGVVIMLVVLLAINSFAIWLRNRYEQQW
jgi:phosphate transport system permease protein